MQVFPAEPTAFAAGLLEAEGAALGTVRNDSQRLHANSPEARQTDQRVDLITATSLFAAPGLAI